MNEQDTSLREQAISVLRRNDRGNYTVPTDGLYPFQWNWDSALCALGWRHCDEPRAWLEMETLFAHQWEDGMVPHIIFHQHEESYYPGPDVWETKRAPPTSGITQPPVAGMVLRQLLENSATPKEARERATLLLPKIFAWHRWFYECRDPDGEGLVSILHPWESGRDNSPDWDAALSQVPIDPSRRLPRKDVQMTNPEHRPSDKQYLGYIALLEQFRALHWDQQKMARDSFFCMVDPGFNAILARSCADLAQVARSLGDQKIAQESQAMSEKATQALETLWSESLGCYLCFDRRQGRLLSQASVGGFLPLLLPIAPHRVQGLAESLEALGHTSTYLAPSYPPRATGFDACRYWRGPVWLIINYLLILGSERAQLADLRQRLLQDSLALVRHRGFAEYYDPLEGSPCGGSTFSWTAAMVLELLQRQ